MLPCGFGNIKLTIADWHDIAIFADILDSSRHNYTYDAGYSY
jgi:hypothetical protein